MTRDDAEFRGAALGGEASGAQCVGSSAPTSERRSSRCHLELADDEGPLDCMSVGYSQWSFTNTLRYRRKRMREGRLRAPPRSAPRTGTLAA